MSVQGRVSSAAGQLAADARGVRTSLREHCEDCKGLRASLEVDGVPLGHLGDDVSETAFTDRLRSARTKLRAFLGRLTLTGSAGKGALVLLTVATLLTYHLLSKVIFGGRPATEQPNKFVLIAFTRIASACLYAGLTVLSLDPASFKPRLLDKRLWLLCAPYALGILGVYVTAMISLEFIALSSRNAIMQSRLLLDLLIGSVFLGARVTPSKLVGVCAIIGAVATSLLTVKQSATSKDPLKGMMVMAVNNVMSSATYAYFPSVLPRFAYPPTLCSFVCALEVLCLCIVGAVLQEGGCASLLNGFRPIDAILILAISLTDTCYFFVPVFLPPIVLTLCVTSTIPSSYLLESLYFGTSIEPQTAVSMAAVGLATLSYVVNGTAVDRAGAAARKAEHALKSSSVASDWNSKVMDEYRRGSLASTGVWAGSEPEMHWEEADVVDASEGLPRGLPVPCMPWRAGLLRELENGTQPATLLGQLQRGGRGSAPGKPDAQLEARTQGAKTAQPHGAVHTTSV